MKVQILQLDAQDDLASARDKLAWAQAQRVVLVWPDRARILRKRLDLVLIRRQAARQGVELGLVTRDPVVLEHAAELGIPVFRSTTRMSEETWQAATQAAVSLPTRPVGRRLPDRPPRVQPRPLPDWLKACVIALLVLSLSAVTLALIPSATITIFPRTNVQEAVLIFTLDPRAQAPDADGSIPARQLSLRPSGSTRVTTTGKTQVPGLPASGEVVFTNLTDNSVLVPAGTGVLPAGRPDLRFATVSDLSLPAGKGAAERMRIVAARPGVVGNLPADSLNAIDGALGLRASVAQPDPLTGGTQTDRAAVAPGDHAAALRLLTEQLLSEAASDIEEELGDGEVLAPASLRVVRTPQRKYDREIGAAADSVRLDLTLEVTGLVYTTNDVDAAAALALAGQRPILWDVVPESLEWAVTDPDPARPELLPARAHQLVYVPIPALSVTRLARGTRPAAAMSRIDGLPGQAQPAQVQTAPPWWPYIPWLEVRIRVLTLWEPT